MAAGTASSVKVHKHFLRPTTCKALLRIRSRKVEALDGNLMSRAQGRCFLRIQTTMRTMVMSEDRHTEHLAGLVAKRSIQEIWFDIG